MLCVSSVIARADDDTNTVALKDTPAPVQKTVNTQVADGKLEEIVRSDRNGEAVYVASQTAKNGDERDFTVADDGTLLSVEVGLSEAPAPVQKTIRTIVTGWELESIDKNLDEAEVSYDVEATKDGKTKSFSVGEDGKTLSIEISLAEAPEPVQKVIKDKIGADKLKTLTKSFDEDGITFDILVAEAGNAEKSFLVSVAGKLLSEQVSLAGVPAAARKTIMEKIGGGKLLRIDKSLFEKKDGVLPYEVHARKDGKPFDFSVGPKGRFFGMDE